MIKIIFKGLKKLQSHSYKLARKSIRTAKLLVHHMSLDLSVFHQGWTPVPGPMWTEALEKNGESSMVSIKEA